MALIDASYFIGEINIPDVNGPGVNERINYMIQKHEENLLIDLLGYGMYLAFINGLQQSTIEQRWLDLLQGKDFTNLQNKLDRWSGFISTPLSSINAVNAGRTEIIVGRGNVNSLNQPTDPVANSNTVYIPDALVGKSFQFEQRAVGYLIPNTEYTVAGNLLTILNGMVFSNLDVYFYVNSNVTINTTTNPNKKSLIANYVYWHWLKDNNDMNAAVGVVKSKTENSVMATPVQRMVTAWNQMSDNIFKLMEFLRVNQSVYTEFDTSRYSHVWYYYKRQNIFGI